jgi:hypothetical protein
VAKRCVQDPALLAQICDVAHRAGRIGLVPYLGSQSTWALASTLAAQSGTPVWVAAPGPRLTRRVNDKLWFSERVTQVLGRRALPLTYYIFGPEALANPGRAARPTPPDRVCIKVPDATGGAGNLILEAKPLARLRLASLRHFCCNAAWVGWHDRYPLLAGDGRRGGRGPLGSALDSPPHAGSAGRGGCSNRPSRKGISSGPRRGALPASECQRLAEEALHLACLFQELGYFGRTSFDAVVLSSGALHWIECNGRWGGVSVPMTLLNRLIGDWQSRSFVIVHQSGLRMPARSFADVVDRLNDRLFRHGGEPRGILFLTADGSNRYGFDFLVLAIPRRGAGRSEENRASLARGERMCRLYGFRRQR